MSCPCSGHGWGVLENILMPLRTKSSEQFYKVLHLCSRRAVTNLNTALNWLFSHVYHRPQSGCSLVWGKLCPLLLFFATFMGQMVPSTSPLTIGKEPAFQAERLIHAMHIFLFNYASSNILILIDNVKLVLLTGWMGRINCWGTSQSSLNMGY